VIFNADNIYASFSNELRYIKQKQFHHKSLIMCDICIVMIYAYDVIIVIVQQYGLLEILLILSKVDAVPRTYNTMPVPQPCIIYRT
jgi:hypothetical protein